MNSLHPAIAFFLVALGLAMMLAYAAAYALASFAFLTGYWHWEAWLAITVLLVTLITGLFVITWPPLCFFGAWLVWDWHWAGSLALAAPTLIIFPTLWAISTSAGGVNALLARARPPR